MASVKDPFRPRACTAGKRDKFGVNFNAMILPDNIIVQPLKPITGRVAIVTGIPIKVREIIIQFEGFCTLPFAKKLAGSIPGVRQSIVGKYKPGKGGYQNSPVKHVLLEEVVSSKSTIHTISEPQAYPFTLFIPGNLCLPTAVDINGISIVYRLALYMKSFCGAYIEVAEKVVRLDGYHNLLYNFEAAKPIQVEGEFQSHHTWKQGGTATLFLESSGFLLGGTIPFLLHVKSEKEVRMELAVSLKQRKYRDCTILQYIGFGLRQKKIKAVREPQMDFKWVDKIDVPLNAGPSFEHAMFTVSYVVKFKVRIFEHGLFKRKAPVYIGTTRNSPEVSLSRGNQLDIPVSGSLRRGSVDTTFRSIISLPPPYSQLSSRAPSIETLPPTYSMLNLQDKNEEKEELEMATGTSQN